MKITFKDIVWIAIVVLIILGLSKCHRDSSRSQREKAEAVIADFKKADSGYKEQIGKLDSLLIAVGNYSREVKQEAQEANEKIKLSEKTIRHLSASLKAAKLLPIDTTFVTVSPDFVTYCDSLADQTDQLTIDLNRYRSTNTALLVSKESELAIKDSMISVERLFNQKYRQQFADLQTIYSKVLNDTKVRNQVFLGAEIIGTQTTVFQNVGAVLSLKTKTNKLWQVSSGLQYNGGLYARINGNILISFKR